MTPKSQNTAVLVVHGFTAGPRTVEHLGVHLARAGYPYAIPTLRGHATHPRDLEGVRWTDWVEDAEAAYLALGRHHERVAIVGHSMGGLVGAILAARHPGTAALVLVAPALVFTNPLVRFSPYIHRLVRTAGGPVSVTDAELLEAAREVNYARFPTSALAQLVLLGRAVRPVLGRVSCPALLLHPRGDRTVREVASRIVLRELGSPDRRLEWLHGTGHDVFLDRGRDDVSARIVRFLDEKLAGAPSSPGDPGVDRPDRILKP